MEGKHDDARLVELVGKDGCVKLVIIGVKGKCIVDEIVRRLDVHGLVLQIVKRTVRRSCLELESIGRACAIDKHFCLPVNVGLGVLDINVGPLVLENRETSRKEVARIAAAH